MKILYDGQIYALQTTGGINRYFSNIINLLPKEIYSTLTVLHRKDKLHYPVHSNLTLKNFWEFRPRRISQPIRARYFQRISNHSSFNIHHPTYYSRLSQDSFRTIRAPLVITVYDMIHELFGDAIEPGGNTIRAKQDAITAADAILCISHSTKADLLKFFPNVESKTTVTHLASEFHADWAYGDEPVPSEPYLLYVGGRTKAYKNFDTLLIAFSKAASINSEIHLAIVGAPLNNEEQHLIAQLKLAHRIKYYQHINDTHLAKLYRCARAFIYPSIYEGFGIPPLEAMTCGTVVIAADSSSIPEVVGDAAILFQPKAVNDLTDILIDVLDSPILCEQLIAKGRKQAQKFSWNKTVEQTVQVYRALSS